MVQQEKTLPEDTARASEEGGQLLEGLKEKLAVCQVENANFKSLYEEFQKQNETLSNSLLQTSVQVKTNGRKV